MIKAARQEALTLTQQILREYWQGGRALLEEHLDEDVMWIGSMDSEYVHGRAAVMARLNENQAAAPLVHLDQENYEIVCSDSLTCLIAGRYRAYTDPDSGLLLSEKQRVTFLWRKQNGRLTILHIHLSNALRIQEENERFPTGTGKLNYDYLQMLLAERSRNEVLSVSDTSGVTHLINYSDLVYAQADRNYTLLVRTAPDEPVRVRRTLSALVGDLPEQFFNVSRSVTVNLRYVRTLKGGLITLMDDTQLRVPVAQRAALRARLARHQGKE